MTNPNDPSPPGDPSARRRPGNQGPQPPPPRPRPESPREAPIEHPRGPADFGEGPTQYIARPGSPMDQPTQEFTRPAPQRPAPPPPRQQPPQQPPPSQQPPQQPPYPQQPYSQPPEYQPQPEFQAPSPPPSQPPEAGGPEGPPPPKPKRRSWFRDPVAIILIIVIVLALIGVGLFGLEFLVRQTANEKIKAATTCETEDSEDTANVSFATVPPVLWQYMTDHYTQIKVRTHGSHVRNAQGMTVDVVVDDVRLNGDSTKKGTIGAINATVTWTTDGILQSIKEAIKEHVSGWVESAVTGIKTDPSAGTITVEGIIGTHLVVKPVVDNGGLRLVIVDNGISLNIPFLGTVTVPTDSVQSTLDE